MDRKNDVIMNVQNSSGTTSHRRVVSLPSFGHFRASFLWSETMKNVVDLSIRVELALFFVEKRARHRAKEYAITCVAFDVVFMVYTLINHSSRPMSAREI